MNYDVRLPGIERTYPNVAHVIGRFVFTTCKQGAYAPVFDGCTTTSIDGWTAGGWCIRLRTTPGRGLVVARIGHAAPAPSTIRRLCSIPVIRRLFVGRFGAVRSRKGVAADEH